MNLWKAIEKLQKVYEPGIVINLDKFERKLAHIKNQRELRIAGENIDIKDLLNEGMDINAFFKDDNGESHNICFHNLKFDYSILSNVKERFYKRIPVKIEKVSIDGVNYAINIH